MPTSPFRTQAQGVVDPWWEDQTPRPLQPYMAIIRVAEKALRAGWSEEHLRIALDEVPVVSGGTLDYWYRRNKTRPVKLTAARKVWLQAIEHDAWQVIHGMLDYREVSPDVRAAVDRITGMPRVADVAVIEAVAS